MVLKRKRRFKKKLNRKMNKRMFGKRIQNRKLKNERGTLTLVRSPEAFTDRYFCKLEWIYTINLQANVPGFVMIYRGNNPNKPSIVALNLTQPKYLDQISEVYGKVRIHASSLRIQGWADAAVSNNNAFITLVPYIVNNKDPFLSLTYADWASMPYAKNTTLSTLGGYNKFYIQNSMTTRKIFGYKSIEDRIEFALRPNGDINTAGSPISEWNWAIVFQSVDGSNVQNIPSQIKIKYFCEFYERRIVRDLMNYGATGTVYQGNTGATGGVCLGSFVMDNIIGCGGDTGPSQNAGDVISIFP